MNLPDVQEVREASSPKGASILLNQGWRLLAILPSRNPRYTAIYILGARTHTDVTFDAPALRTGRRKRS